MNVKNELTNAVGLASSYDANGNLTNRVYDATGRARVRTDYVWSGSAWAAFLNAMLGTRGSGSLPRQVGLAARVLGEHRTN